MLQPVKTPAQIKAMRVGGKILATILAGLRKYVKPGMTGLDVDDWVGREIKHHGASATYLEPQVNFPNNICISTNEQIVHAIPTDEPFQIGDVVAFDLTITYQQMKVDSAFTMVIGQKPAGAKKMLLNQTEKALYAGIDKVAPGVRVGDISAAIEAVLKKAGLGVVRELVGHGVGNEMHLPPEIPNFGAAGTGPILSAGDTLAIEPMATLGKPDIMMASDGWSISTRDGSLAAHFEHTVLVAKDGYEILTKL